MRLSSVSVAGFRSIDKMLPLPLGRPSVITGENDGGKTTFLQAVTFLLNSYTVTDRDHTYRGFTEPSPVLPGVEADSAAAAAERCEVLDVVGLFDLSEQEQDSFELTSPVRLRRRHTLGQSAIYEVETAVSKESELRDLDRLKLDELKSLCQKYGVTATGTKAVLMDHLSAKARTFGTELAWAAAPAPLVRGLPPLLVFSSDSNISADETIRRTLTTAYKTHLSSGTFAGKIAEIESELDALLEADVEKLLKHVSLRCPDIGEIRIVPSASLTAGVKDATITVTPRPGEEVRLSESGAGRARRVALAVWEGSTSTFEPGSNVVLIYDEPDTHLDYQHQRELMRIILEQAADPSQTVLVATHSMNLIDGVDIGDVAHFHLEDYRSKIDLLKDQSQTGQHLGSIAASLGLRNTVLLHERLFVGVEGATELAALPVLFRLATGKHLETCGIAIWSCANNEGALSFAKFLKEHGRNVVFLVDYDSVTNNPRMFSNDRLKGQNLDPNQHALYWGEPSELEELFSDDTFARICQDLWPRSDERRWVPADFASLRQGKFSAKLLDMLRQQCFEGPSGKPAVMTGIASRLARAEVPEQMKERFHRLVELAS